MADAMFLRLAPGLRAWPRLRQEGANMQLRPLAGHNGHLGMCLVRLGRDIRPVGPGLLVGL